MRRISLILICILMEFTQAACNQRKIFTKPPKPDVKLDITVDSAGTVAVFNNTAPANNQTVKKSDWIQWDVTSLPSGETLHMVSLYFIDSYSSPPFGHGDNDNLGDASMSDIWRRIKDDAVSGYKYEYLISIVTNITATPGKFHEYFADPDIVIQ